MPPFSIMLFGLLAGTVNADAESMRYYDPEAFCSRVVKNLPKTDLERCLRSEGRSYGFLKSIWETVPNHVRTYCQEHSIYSEYGSYLMLRACVETEMKKAEEKGRDS